MKDSDQEYRLRRFWGVAIFSLGILWGFSSLVYVPEAVLTSVRGSSWLEVFVVAAGGILSLAASIRAFYHRSHATVLLLAGGVVLLAVAICGQILILHRASGIVNLILLLLPGAIAVALGLFGKITERKGWPSLRGEG